MKRSRSNAATTIQRSFRKRIGAKFRRWSTVKQEDRTYRFARTVTSNSAGDYLVIGTDAGGVYKYFNGANNATNLQVTFSLQQMVVYLGGVAQITSVVPDYAEFTSLFDQWCIEKVELTFIPTFTNQSIAARSRDYDLQNHVYCIDNDDAGSATALQIQQYANCKYTQLCESAKDGKPRPLAVFKPKPAIAVYQTGATFAYGALEGMNNKKMWIDVAYPTAPHYAFKMAMDNYGGTATANATQAYVNVVAKIHYAFKTVR